MVGQITGVTTTNETKGIFGTVSTTTNTNIAIPGFGVSGGVGDIIIICSGIYTLSVDNVDRSLLENKIFIIPLELL